MKNKQEACENFVEISRNDDNTTGNLLEYLHQQNYDKLIDIDLSRQTDTTIPKQINVTERFEEGSGATMLFITEKQQKTILNFSLDSINGAQ